VVQRLLFELTHIRQSAEEEKISGNGLALFILQSVE